MIQLLDLPSPTSFIFLEDIYLDSTTLMRIIMYVVYVLRLRNGKKPIDLTDLRRSRVLLKLTSGACSTAQWLRPRLVIGQTFDDRVTINFGELFDFLLKEAQHVKSSDKVMKSTNYLLLYSSERSGYIISGSPAMHVLRLQTASIISTENPGDDPKQQNIKRNPIHLLCR